MAKTSRLAADRLNQLFHKLSNRVGELSRIGPGFAVRGAHRLAGRATYDCLVSGFGQVRFRLGTADAEVLKQVFRDRQYDIPSREHAARVRASYEKILACGDVPLIIDCGAHIGAAAMWFATEFPEAKIIAVEPDEANAELCRHNTAGLTVETVTAAIGAREGRATLLKDGQDVWGYQTRRAAAGGVPVVSIAGLREAQDARHQLLVVKVDIEGFESDLFAENIEWLDDISLLFVEPHDYLSAHAPAVTATMQRALADRDFHMLISGENLVFIR